MIRIFSHWLRAHTVLWSILDVALICLSIFLALSWLEHRNPAGVAALMTYALPAALGMAMLGAAFGVRRHAPGTLRGRTAAGVGLSFLLAAPLAYGMVSLLPAPQVEREELELAGLLALCAVVAIRGLSARHGFSPLLARRVLVLGTGAEAAFVEQTLVRSDPDVRVVGFYPVRSDEAPHVSGDRVLADDGSLTRSIRRLRVNEIIVAVRDRRSDSIPLHELLDCRLTGVRVLDMSSYFERALGQVRLDSLRASWLIFGEGFRQGRVRTVVKRLFDVVFAALLLGVLWPLMLASALAIVVESGFPFVYRQTRIGQGGRPYRLLTFRTMGGDAEPDGTPRRSRRNDERVTRVGRVLRRLRIDELPQLINVLKGEMSLVGPRPERPHFVEKLAVGIPFYATRHSVKPGITGWAQVRHQPLGSVDDAVEKLQFDLYYVKNHTLFLDTVVLFETVGVVLSGRGAH